MGNELVITNGDVAANLISSAFPDSEVLPWCDVIHEGPVPLTEDLPSLSRIRAQYLAEAYSIDCCEVEERLRNRDAILANHVTFDQTVLWFEHDLYDQLQLIQILDYFASNAHEKNAGLFESSGRFSGTSEPRNYLQYC